MNNNNNIYLKYLVRIYNIKYIIFRACVVRICNAFFYLHVFCEVAAR